MQCRAIQNRMLRHQALTYQDTAHADSILLLFKLNQKRISSWCTDKGRLWMRQPYVHALEVAGHYNKVLHVVSESDTSAILQQHRARALYHLGRHKEAHKVFALSARMYAQRQGIDQVMALFNLNWAWNMYRLERYAEARSLLDRSERVLKARCCDVVVLEGLKEIDRLRGALAGRGHVEQNREDEPRHEASAIIDGIWGTYLLLLAVMIMLGLLAISTLKTPRQ